jgi:CubicO group peptidase (beta-lactamase class C family)
MAGCSRFDHVDRPLLPKVINNEQDLRKIVDDIVLPFINEKQFLGAVVAITTPFGDFIYPYGVQDKDNNIKMSGDELFQIGSITKVFTTSLLALIADEQKINLNSAIESYLPDHFVPAHRNFGQLTFSKLAGHTAGFSLEYFDRRQFVHALSFLFNGENIWRHYVAADLVSTLEEFRIDGSVNHKYNYTNVSTLVLGWLLENYFKTPYEDLIRQKLFSYLDLKNTGFELTPDVKNKLAKGYSGDYPPFMKRNQLMSPWELPYGLRASGGAYSNAKDLLNFLKWNMGKTHRDKLHVVKTIHTPITVIPRGEMSMGWFIQKLQKSPVKYHYSDGVFSGSNSFIGFDEDAKFGVVVLENSMSSKNFIAENILGSLVGI